MYLAIPKMVQIKNTKISLVYYSLLVATFVWIIVLNYYQQSYLLQVDIVDSMHSLVWIQPDDDEAIFEHTRSVMANTGLCSSSSTFDYMYDANFIFSNHTCLLPCGMQELKEFEDCLDFKDFGTVSGNDIFLFTASRSNVLTLHGDEEEKHHFLPGSTSAHIFMEYSFNVGDKSSWPWWTGDPYEGKSSKDVLTIMIKRNDFGVLEKTPWKVLYPDVNMKFTIAELLTLAGVHNVLDETNPAAGKNLMPNAQNPEGPVGRQTGVRIYLDLSCYNTKVMHGKYLDEPLDWPSGKICYLTAQRSDNSWVFKSGEIRKNKWGNEFAETHYALAFSVEQHGTFYFWDLVNILDVLIAVMVLAKIPSTIVSFIVKYGLGATSRVYELQTNEVFSLQNALAGGIARLLMYHRFFSSVAEGDEEVSKLALENELIETLANQEKLSNEEIYCLSEFWFHSVTQAKAVNTSEEPTVNVKDFLAATMSLDRIPLEDMLNLCDQDRKAWFLERLFMEPGVAKLSHSGARSVVNQQCSVERISTVRKSLTDADTRRVSFASLPRPTLYGGDASDSSSQNLMQLVTELKEELSGLANRQVEKDDLINDRINSMRQELAQIKDCLANHTYAGFTNSAHCFCDGGPLKDLGNVKPQVQPAQIPESKLHNNGADPSINAIGALLASEMTESSLESLTTEAELSIRPDGAQNEMKVKIDALEKLIKDEIIDVRTEICRVEWLFTHEVVENRAVEARGRSREQSRRKREQAVANRAAEDRGRCVSEWPQDCSTLSGPVMHAQREPHRPQGDSEPHLLDASPRYWMDMLESQRDMNMTSALLVDVATPNCDHGRPLPQFGWPSPNRKHQRPSGFTPTSTHLVTKHAAGQKSAAGLNIEVSGEVEASRERPPHVRAGETASSPSLANRKACPVPESAATSPQVGAERPRLAPRPMLPSQVLPLRPDVVRESI